MAISNTTSTKESGFHGFEWHKEGADKLSISSGPAIRLAGEVQDSANGIATILEIIEHDNGRSGSDRVLNGFQAGTLVRMAIAAARNLDSSAESFSRWVEEHHMPTARTSGTH